MHPLAPRAEVRSASARSHLLSAVRAVELRRNQQFLLSYTIFRLAPVPIPTLGIPKRMYSCLKSHGTSYEQGNRLEELGLFPYKGILTAATSNSACFLAILQSSTAAQTKRPHHATIPGQEIGYSLQSRNQSPPFSIVRDKLKNTSLGIIDTLNSLQDTHYCYHTVLPIKSKFALVTYIIKIGGKKENYYSAG